uniref:glycosyltransferase family 2 protein n=1 Tax=Phaeovulum sp. TaxID=2934796 RepID=UPI0039E2529D
MTQAAALRTSLIIVSRHRPAALARCLAAVAQLDHAAFEVIVVADPAALVHVPSTAKAAAFDLPNISAARNAGLALAAGEVVAFLDDDAVPEPSWLRRLTAPFVNPDVVAAGGFVRARNGISFQWKASVANALGEAFPLDVDQSAPSLHPARPGMAIRTEGTNCAFRLGALAAIGGFDPAFRFYLDETDVNMRLARNGHLTAIVPMAQVHHGFAASARRHADRAPKTLFDIGASSAVFWRKHADPGAEPAARARLIAAQHSRLIRHMVSGTLEPRDVVRLIATLEAGLMEGANLPLGHLPPLRLDPPPFLLFPTD